MSELFWLFGFNIIVNSVLSFATTVILLKFFLYLLRVEEPRLLSCIWFLPLVKLFVDPFLYDFNRWALVQNINPWEAEKGSRMLSLQFCVPSSDASFTTSLQLFVHDMYTFTLADLLSWCIGRESLQAIVALFLLCSIVSVGCYVYKMRRVCREVKNLIKDSVACTGNVHNPLLHATIKKQNVQLLVSREITVPCAFGLIKKRIILPSDYGRLFSQEEFEAIIAHELEHLLWYDGLTRLLALFVAKLFWWIPSRGLRKGIESRQEYASDRAIKKYQLRNVDLASAIVKVARQVRSETSMSLFASLQSGHLVASRMQQLCEEKSHKISFFEKYFKRCVVCILASLVIFGRYWIF